jgi:integrase
MARQSKPPSYLLHRQSGQAMTVVKGPDGRRKQVLLGPYGSDESKAQYARIVAEWDASPARLTSRTPATPLLTVADVAAKFMAHARLHYRHPDGTPTSEVNNHVQAFKRLTEVYGPTPAADFSPLKLKALRRRWIDDGICRPQVNARAGRVRRLFRWASAEELVPLAVHQALALVAGLQKGRTEAAEPDPVTPVPDAHFDTVLPYLRGPARDLVRLLRVSGMRPSEGCLLRWRDIDQTADVWVYRPGQHKTGWRGKERVVLLGPQARAILTTYSGKDPDAFVFDPRDAVAGLHAERAERRVTKFYESRQGWQKASERGPSRVRGRYDVNTLNQAVRRACGKAAVLVWSTGQLRHSFATAARKAGAVEVVKTLLGHAYLSTTEIYAERDLGPAAELIKRVG